MLNWDKLKPHSSTQMKSFEQLCYHLAKRSYQHLGEFTPIDDSGGGDGVEFYLTFPDGTQWGWQAKFYFPNPRLAVSSRKGSVIGSLTKTQELHPNLKKWFLCIPSDFTPAEQAWFTDTLQTKAPGVELVHWGESDLSFLIAQPKMAGILSFFFGELDLTEDWFHGQVHRQTETLRRKFIPDLHTETEVDEQVHWTLGDDSAVSFLQEQITNAEQSLSEAKQQFSKALTLVNDWPEAKQTVERLPDLLNQAGDLLALAQITTKRIESGEYPVDFDFRTTLEPLMDETAATTTQIWTLYPEDNKPVAYPLTPEQQAQERRRRNVSEILSITESLSNFLHNVLRVESAVNEYRQVSLHILGQAGIGKTHALANLSESRVESGLPTLFMHGRSFIRSRTIQSRILELCDLPAQYSWQDFLETLQCFAEVRKTRVLIAIDALNEAESVDVWSELPGILKDLQKFPRLLLVTTCRTSYREAIWPEGEKHNFCFSWGLRDALEEAIAKYFAYYKLHADLTLAPLRQFEHPLYLRIFCEAQNPARTEEKEIYIGEQTLFGAFGDLIQDMNRGLVTRFNRAPGTPLVHAAMSRIAEELWRQSSRTLTLSEVLTLLDGSDDAQWHGSITQVLLDEGLLIARDWKGTGEVVSFTYDLFGGYVIAQSLVSGLESAELVEFVRSDQFRNRLLAPPSSDTRHPLADDILRCFAALVPEKTGSHLYQLLPHDNTALGFSVDAMFEMSPALVTAECQELIVKLFEIDQNRPLLFDRLQDTSVNTRHPLNMEFTHKLLGGLPLADRDVYWTEWVRKNASNIQKEIDRLETSCRSDSVHTPLMSARYCLAATYMMWLLTSTNRLLRDKATRSLYWYGRRYSDQLLDMTLDSLAINDPYIPERMLAASYGVAMALHALPHQDAFKQKTLPSYCDRLYDAMFRRGAPHGTTHVLMRDYGRQTIEIALLHVPDLFGRSKRRRFRPPYRYGGLRHWGRWTPSVKEFDMEPIQMDFHNYTLGRLFRGRRNYDDTHPGFKDVLANIYWRIRSLGYNNDQFASIEKSVTSSRRIDRGEESATRIDRYGKKYSWIAFFEMYGLREDLGLMKDRWGDRRPSDIDIDPSFPESPHIAQVITEDFVEPMTDMRAWIEASASPNIAPYLLLDTPLGFAGHWLALDAFVSVEDGKLHRNWHAVVRSLIVHRADRNALVNDLQIDVPLGHQIEPPSEYYTFAGEAPWSYTFPINGVRELAIPVGARKRRYARPGLRWTREGEPIDMQEVRVLHEEVCSLSTEEERKIFLEKHNLEVELIEEVELIDRAIHHRHRVFTPVRSINWESYHSGVNLGQSVDLPAREIAKAMGLWMHVPHWDMFESDGTRASIAMKWEQGDDYQTWTFLRKDLLDKFLDQTDSVLIWLISGERQFWSPGMTIPAREQLGFSPYNTFTEAFEYRDGAVVRIVHRREKPH